jgi:NADH:ubiquinone oxidoreductase subunit 5 (subunit L)/multisubunit Na+/H+ antiporter MnhA subunit
LFYLFTYSFIVIGSFAIVDVIQGEGEARSDIGALRGLARRQPVLAAAMLILLLAQAGVPFTSGFLGKFYVIQAAVQQGQYYLAVVAMVAAAGAAFFYLRVALLMYSSSVAGAGGGYGAGSGAGAGSGVVSGAGFGVVSGVGVGAGSGAVAGSGVGVGAGSGAVAGSGAGSVHGASASLDELGVFEAGLAPVPSLDPEGSTVLTAEAPASLYVPSGIFVVVAITTLFTVAAGVAPFAVDFAKAATALF